jgi:hypothetical protein
MDGIYQTMPIPDVNNNRKREPVNKKSWSPNDDIDNLCEPVLLTYVKL